MSRNQLRISVAVLLALAAGCSSARMSDHVSDDLFRRGDYDAAATRLKAGYEKEGDSGADSLLYLLDEGLALHSEGKFDESNKVFLKADKLAEIKDYTHISTEAATLIASENITNYKGEDFENVLISVYLSMNYALMGNFEDALVEARRVNQKLYMMVNEGKRKYKQNAFARYISAIMYEGDGNYNDAYIDYKNTYDLMPAYPALGRDLWRVATLNGMDDEAEKWDETFHLTPQDHQSAMAASPKSGRGEIIILYENGISPVKVPNPQWESLPMFIPRFNPAFGASVEVNGQVMVNTSTLENIEATAVENLEEKYGGMIAKKIAGLAVKGAVGYGVAKVTHSPMLGYLAAWALAKSDQADLRSWNLLPRDLQVARIPIVPGTYSIRVLPSGGPASGSRTVQVQAGKKVFVNFRYMP